MQIFFLLFYLYSNTYYIYYINAKIKAKNEKLKFEYNNIKSVESVYLCSIIVLLPSVSTWEYMTNKYRGYNNRGYQSLMLIVNLNLIPPIFFPLPV